MDVGQLIFGLIVLFAGGAVTFKNTDRKAIVLGILLIIVGLTFTLAGFGIKI